MFVQMFTLISSRYFFQKWGIKGKHDNKKNNILTNTFVCIYILQIIYLLLFISHICRIETVNESVRCVGMIKQRNLLVLNTEVIVLVSHY